MEDIDDGHTDNAHGHNDPGPVLSGINSINTEANTCNPDNTVPTVNSRLSLERIRLIRTVSMMMFYICMVRNIALYYNIWSHHVFHQIMRIPTMTIAITDHHFK